jgi:hypothetical protein
MRARNERIVGTGNLHCLFVEDRINEGMITTYLFLKLIGKINKVMHWNILM